MEKRDWILYIIFLILSLSIFFLFINALQTGSYYTFFWICYIILIPISIGLIKRNPSLILSQIIIMAIPDLLWTFDFFYMIFSGHTLLGIVGYYPGENFLGKILSLQHLYVIPLSLIALSIMKIKRNYKILLISLGEVSLIFLLTLVFVPVDSGINCVHVSCISVPLTFLPFYLIWFILEFGFTIISYFIITALPFVKKN